MDAQLLAKVEAFFSKYKQQVYKKGEILIRADDEPSGVFFLTEGVVKEYLISQKGDEVILHIFQPQSFFPATWVINNTKNIFYFEVVVDKALVWRAPKEEVISFLTKNPDLNWEVLKRMAKEIEELKLRLAFGMSESAYARLILSIVLFAKEVGIKDEVSGGVKIPMIEKYAAAMTGLTQETVSREFKILKQKELVVFERNTMLIKNLEQLEDELSLY